MIGGSHGRPSACAELATVKGGQQALLAQWTAAATEARQGRDEINRLAEALAARDAETASLHSAH